MIGIKKCLVTSLRIPILGVVFGMRIERICTGEPQYSISAEVYADFNAEGEHTLVSTKAVALGTYSWVDLSLSILCPIGRGGSQCIKFGCHSSGKT